MPTLLVQVAACIALLALPAGASADTAATPSAERGLRLYMEKMCFTCHGTVGQGGERGTGPQIAPTQWPLDAFVQQMRHPRLDMPRYPAKYVSDQELADLHAYLASIKPPRPVREIELLNQAP